MRSEADAAEARAKALREQAERLAFACGIGAERQHQALGKVGPRMLLT